MFYDLWVTLVLKSTDLSCLEKEHEVNSLISSDVAISWLCTTRFSTFPCMKRFFVYGLTFQSLVKILLNITEISSMYMSKRMCMDLKCLCSF
jgi:hypothetical protein